MKFLRSFALATSMVALCQSVFGATYLCVEDTSTGFNWENGEWVQANFFPIQNIIQKRSLDDDIAMACATLLESEGRSTDVTEYTNTISTSWGCYSQIAVGDEADMLDVSICQELHRSGKISAVICNEGPGNQYKFAPAGEFVIVRTGGVPMPADIGLERNSLALSVGKCSAIAP